MSYHDPEVVLQKVLRLERKQSFRNRAAAGGLEGFTLRLVDEADASPRLRQLSSILAGYQALNLADRSAVIDRALAAMDGGAPPAIAPTVDRQLSDTSGRSSPIEAGVPAKPPRAAGADDVKAMTTVARTKSAKREPASTSKKQAQPRQRKSALETLALGSPLSAVPSLRNDMREALARVRVETIRDLLFYFPRDHYDYRSQTGIGSLRYGEKTTLVGTVERASARYPRRGFSVTTVVVSDKSGSIPVRWFNQPYLAKSMTPGRRIAITGTTDLFNGYPVFVPRDYEWIDEGQLTHGGRLVPVYPLTKGLYQKSLRSLIHRLLSTQLSQLIDHLPERLRVDLGLMALPDAVTQYHFPDEEQVREEAKRRLAFDEIFAIQLGLVQRKHQWQDAAPGRPLNVAQEALQRFAACLPFALTAAQSRVMHEIGHDVSLPRPMSRLLQGDVGSGKTAVASYALWLAGCSELQSVLMAPTEILAEQHFRTISRLFEPFGYRVDLLLGSTRAKNRREALAATADGDVDVLIGTHALIQEGVEFARLGVAVVDEQHRFGVEQRAQLRQKGHNPHVLAMTATPIPRTLALTIYGDLDISVLDELPPGRQPVLTTWVSSAARAYSQVRSEVERGRQAFVVCPVIEESSETDMKSVMAEHRYLTRTIFPRLQVGLLHGRMKGTEKERVLQAFRDGSCHVLVSTSVVEVGIDIPNATVMVVRDAHRFGLAQLHQFRGRIGRGADRSYCLLVSDVEDNIARERLGALLRSNDGFALAEADLKQRGPGEFWGTRQSGLPELRVARVSDVSTIEMARRAALQLVATDPQLSAPDHAALRGYVDRFWSSGLDLS